MEEGGAAMPEQRALTRRGEGGLPTLRCRVNVEDAKDHYKGEGK